MSGGFRFENKEIRKFPLRAQEQMALQVVAQISAAAPVADHPPEKRPGLKVPVRRLHFPAGSYGRYLVLKDAAREGVISDPVLIMQDEEVCGFSYTIFWSGEYLPTGLPFSDLDRWRLLGRGARVREFIKKRGDR